MGCLICTLWVQTDISLSFFFFYMTFPHDVCSKIVKEAIVVVSDFDAVSEYVSLASPKSCSPKRLLPHRALNLRIFDSLPMWASVTGKVLADLPLPPL